MWFWKHSLSPLVGRLATSRQFALAPPRTALDELVTVGVAAGLGVVMPFIVRNGWPKAPPLPGCRGEVCGVCTKSFGPNVLLFLPNTWPLANNPTESLRDYADVPLAIGCPSPNPRFP
jgi:hypothetical protein